MKANKRRKEKQKIKRAEKKAKKEIVRFYLIFPPLFLIIILSYSFALSFIKPQVNWISSRTAVVLGFILNLFGMSANTSGPLLTLQKFSIRVVTECTGLCEMLIFLAALLAYPSSFKKKMLGVLFGIPLLYIVNIIRMIFITVVGNWYPQTFNFMHLYFWQVVGILIIGGVWLFWIEKIVKYERETADIHS